MDVYEPGPGPQINDFNPGIAPSGLFWTMAIPPESVDVEFEDGAASMRVTNIGVRDFHDIENALFGGGPPPVPATVSFDVRWSGIQERVRITNPAQGFKGKYVRNHARMQWSAMVGGFRFVSAPLSTSSSVFAELGREHNGSFFEDD